MALLQISEPGMSPAPHQRKRAVGIDLGTTNSLVATVQNGVPMVLTDAQGNALLPSAIRYRAGESPIVGALAKDAAASDPLNTLLSVKRLMGRGLQEATLPYRYNPEVTAVPRIITAAGEISAVEASAEILKALRARAQAALAGELDGVVITVPAYFDDAQRQATKDAARLAGLNVLRLLNEPTAAAVAYGLDRGAEGIHAVYDLGGGTFDFSILRFARGVFEVLATSGDAALGGDDIDQSIADWLCQQAGIEAATLPPQAWRALLKEACRAKEALTEQASVTVTIARAETTPWQGALTREQFDALIEPLVQRTLAPCRRALRDAGLHIADIQEVVMVGGSTRTPRVRAAVAEFFGKPVMCELNPDQVVALGAAIQADILVGNKPDAEMLLLDVIPLSLGIETMGGLVERILPRNTPIPATRAQEFTTYKDGQTAMAIHVLQGERERVADCRSLARFELRGIPPLAAGAARIRVTFQVDADGLLSVIAREQTTGIEAQIQVQPAYGLREEEISCMLRDSLTHAPEDIALRQLIEQQVAAEGVLLVLESALRQDAHLLDGAERATLNLALARLKATLQGHEARAIKAARENLEQAAAGFAQRRMDVAIQQALTGKTIMDL